MSDKAIRVIIIDDDPGEAGFFERELEKAGLAPSVTRVEDGQALEGALERGAELAIYVHGARRLTAADALETLKRSAPDVPFIVVLSEFSEEAALDCLRRGADDCVSRDRLYWLGPSAVRSLEQKRLLKDRNEAIRALKESEELFRATAESAADAIICIEEPDSIYFWNRKAEEMLGYTRSEVMGKRLHALVVPKRYYGRAVEAVDRFFRTGLGANIGRTVEFEARRKDGSEFPIELSISSMYAGGKWKSVGIIRDVSDRKRVEEERLKVQKLESLGLLAGGIAHDFNNLLTTILGNIELADMDKDPAETHRKLIEAERIVLMARNLSQQLTTFARGGTPLKKPVSIAELVDESIAQSLKAASVRCATSCPEGLWRAEADEIQLIQVFNNILLNAEQAMPGGGAIEIGCSNKALGADNPLQLREGRYVKVSFRDNGPGIPREHLSRLFEPYFTTKQRGSGLGLAIAYSIIRNHGGSITVSSEVNAGTAFEIYLPASEAKAEAPSLDGRRVLVLESDEEIRRLLSRLLGEIGYSATLSAEGYEAVAKYREAFEAGRPFDLVMIDLAAHDGMGAVDTVRELRGLDPSVKAIATSSFYGEEVIEDFRSYGFKAALHKPYSVTELKGTLAMVRESGQ